MYSSPPKQLVCDTVGARCSSCASTRSCTYITVKKSETTTSSTGRRPSNLPRPGKHDNIWKTIQKPVQYTLIVEVPLSH